jgi:xanthine dehydrogenase YagR molybdenum-binding subunit
MSLCECYEEGARRFGWSRRTPSGSTREGRDLVGCGVATAQMPFRREHLL